MTTAQLEIAIANQYDNGRYRPLGADGGTLKYILVDVNNKIYRVSITLDHEISKIRRIWELSETTYNSDNSFNLNAKKIYDYTKQYYNVSK